MPRTSITIDEFSLLSRNTEDCDLLSELFALLAGCTDQEERVSAAKTILEILGPQDYRIKRVL